MRRTIIGLGAALPALCLSTGLALAQATPPTLKQPDAAPQNAQPPAPTASAPTPSAPTPPTPGASGGTPGQGAMAAPNGPPEGMVVETPNGLYLVRPGQAARRFDMGRPRAGGPGMGEGPRMGQSPQPGDEAAEDMGGPGMEPPPGGPMPPPPPESKGARFSVRTPNLTLTMKCPDDEPLKNCVDAVSQLLDKASTQGH